MKAPKDTATETKVDPAPPEPPIDYVPEKSPADIRIGYYEEGFRDGHFEACYNIAVVLVFVFIGVSFIRLMTTNE